MDSARSRPVIEVLVFPDCPNRVAAAALAREVAQALGIPAEVREVEVRDTAEAERLRFLGSPSVRVDGRDVEAGAEARSGYGLACRTYGASGVPPRALVEAALRVAHEAP